VPETIAYYDAGHLSTAGSLYLAPYLNCFMGDHSLFNANATSP